jgi:hypothetical protein
MSVVCDFSDHSSWIKLGKAGNRTVTSFHVVVEVCNISIIHHGEMISRQDYNREPNLKLWRS